MLARVEEMSAQPFLTPLPDAKPAKFPDTKPQKIMYVHWKDCQNHVLAFGNIGRWVFSVKT